MFSARIWTVDLCIRIKQLQQLRRGERARPINHWIAARSNRPPYYRIFRQVPKICGATSSEESTTMERGLSV